MNRFARLSFILFLGLSACAEPSRQPPVTPTLPPASSPSPAATAAPPLPAGSPMFRGEASHRGVYADQGPAYEWAYDTGERIISSPAPSGDRVFIQTISGRLIALDLATGRELWAHAGGGESYASPAVVDGAVYTASGSGKVVCLDAGSGGERWSFQADDAVLTSPAVFSGRVYFATIVGQVFALDAETGKEAWRYDTRSYVISSPVVTEDGLFIGTNDDFLVALDPASGEKLWMFLAEGGDVQSSPAYAGGVVFVGAGGEQAGALAAVDARSGKKLWQMRTDRPVAASPAVVGGTVYVGGADGVFAALDAASGTPRWTFETGAAIISSAAVTGDSVIFGSTNGRVYALDRQSGMELWNFPTLDEVWSSPSVVGDTVLFGSYDGRLYAVNRTAPSQALVPSQAPVALAPTPTRMPPPEETPEPGSGNLPWWNDRVFYEVFVRSFKDSDGDGTGDLRGLIDSLDYLNDGNPATATDLGVTGLWLMPVTESPSYHGYDVTDYKNVEPDYGTNEDLRELIADAHERGMVVIVDLVMNHTSSEHPWFQDALRRGSEHENWYIWSQERPDMLSPWGSQVWHLAGTRYYYGLFWEGMPDLNFRNGEVTAAMFDIIDFWLSDMAVDGFRLDAVRHLVEEGAVQENTASTHEWLMTFHNYVKNTAPQSLTVGEAWTSTEEVVKFIGDEVDIAFEFDLAEQTIRSVLIGTSTPLRAAASKALASYPQGQYATFLTNHDQNRVFGQLGGSAEKARLAAGLLLSSSGVPFLYYGEEIGLQGAKPDERIRTPMQWSAEMPGAGFTTGTPWQPLAGNLEAANVAAQTADPDSLLSFYRGMIALRQEHPALRSGQQLLVEADQDAVYSFVRSGGGESLLVVANLSSNAIDSYSLSLVEGPLSSVQQAEQVLGAGSPRVPQVNAEGGFDSYTPLDSLPPLSLSIIRLR